MPGFLKVFGYYDAETKKWAIDVGVLVLMAPAMKYTDP